METFIAPTDRADVLRTAVRQAVDFLKEGEVVALPTETVYGLAADALNPEAVARIFSAKERPSYDPLIVHLPHRRRLEEVAEIPPETAETISLLIAKFWPGALTLVLPKKETLSDAVTGGLPTVAVRMSSHPVFKAVITSFGQPLAAPSANRFGRISPTSAQAVFKELEGRIPLILDGGACPEGLESTILKVLPAEGKGKPTFRILRAGPITREDLLPFGKIEWANGQPDKKGHVAAPEVPGQLAHHYAPVTPLRLLENPSQFQPEPGKRYALLSYRGDAEDGYANLTDWEQILVLSPGSGKLPEAALRLFHCLRTLDELGVDEIIAEPVPHRELGVAIMERLRRASRV